MNLKYDCFVDCDSLPGLQKPLFPGLCCWRWRGLKKLQCLLVLSTSISSIFASPYLAHRAIFITPADWHESPQGIVAIQDYLSILPPLQIRQCRMQKDIRNCHNSRNLCMCAYENC